MLARKLKPWWWPWTWGGPLVWKSKLRVGGLRAEPPENFDKNEGFWSIFKKSRGRTLTEENISTKINAFEAFTSDLEVELWWGSGVEPPKNFDENKAFEAFSSNLEAKPSWGMGAEPPKILTKISAFEEFSSYLGVKPWWGLDQGQASKKFWQK